ncbi:DUF6418 domain-containing protein [Sphingomonas radiodurans]|uniref:DUF6418 domain-containing protein n=1 Tax=Sphingomonas radiodurans TaxID=2890321 RepID=UPI001E382D50|nr:DUF6418 domain-containing protein [Sphingomonas radiodurans]WBH18082.1 DUF6418 domain-containing protein [Sphingomonas radiodurans]
MTADPHAAPRTPIPFGGLVALTTALALNWFAAAAVASPWFSWTSLLLFGCLLVLIGRISAAGLILLLPLVITRGATMLSLLVIEAGAYMPEVNRLGAPGDASASFVAFTAVFFIVFALVFRRFEALFIAYARSPMLDRLVALLGWPVVALCAALGAIAFLNGAQTGFPLLDGVDRFLYRREYSSPLVLILLDNKFLLAAMLGAIAFAPGYRPMLKPAATGVFLGLTGTYFLFGDKFFTILAEVSFFAMPLLLARQGRLAGTMLRLAPPVLALLFAALAATLHIYSGYGRLPLGRTMTLVGERIAGQGELWFVATRDARRMTHWDTYLVNRNIETLDAISPPATAFANSVETYYFIQRYAPAKLADSFRKNGGWVQLTMGTEAMALVTFGWLGVAAVMTFLGILLALAALFLRRGFASAFPLTLFFAVWTFLQVYVAAQQASLWPIAAPGQVKRLLLFATIEIVLLAFNRAQVTAEAGRERAAWFRRSRTA